MKETDEALAALEPNSFLDPSWNILIFANSYMIHFKIRVRSLKGIEKCEMLFPKESKIRL